MRTKILLLTALPALFIGPVYAGVFTVSHYGFSGERPSIPFEATTFEQDELFEATRMRRDGKEEESTAACAALIADETAPFELRAWAVRKKMTLDIYTGRCVEAVRTGRDWLREYGDKDPYALYIRRVMTNAIVNRCGLDSVFAYEIEELRAVYEDMFANHPPDNRYVINARYQYARALEQLSVKDESLRFDAAREMEAAAVAMLDHMMREEYQQEPDHVQELCELLLYKCRADMARILSSRWTPPRRHISEEASEEADSDSSHPRENRQQPDATGRPE